MNSLDMNRQVTLCGSNIVAEFAFEHQLSMMSLDMLMQLTIGGYRIVTFFTFPLLQLLMDTIDVNFFRCPVVRLNNHTWDTFYL